jgi:CRISPR-associated protein Cmx8
MTHISRKGEALILELDLFSLPTAQHKAGLAGLLVHLDSLQRRRISPIPQATATPAGAEIEITRDSLQTVFDDLYDAEWREVESRQKWREKEPKRLETRKIEGDDKEKIEKRFIYDAVVPKGLFVKDLFRDDSGVWVNLWRTMLWNILRGIPKTRGIYEERAKKRPSSLAAEFWHSLLKAFSLQEQGAILTDPISSAMFVGAEDINPEKVPFQGPVAENFLLHFWPLVSLIFVPQVFDLERTKDQGLKIYRQERGYVLAIPDPLNLKDFCKEFEEMAKSLDPDSAGFRPKFALIDLAEEGALEYLYHFARHRIQMTELSLSLAAVEFYHLQKSGNRIRQLAAERLLPKQDILKDYERFRGNYANFLYKSLYLQNLLAGVPWHLGAEGIFSRYPWPMFIHLRDKTPRQVRFFGLDVRKKLEAIAYDLQLKREGGLMSDRELDDQLALRINRLIQEYVNRRTEEKSKIKFKDFSHSRDDKGRIRYPREYREAREKVCSDAFLALRSRRDQAFIDYFTGTICSIPQFLPEAELLMVSRALKADWPRIKTLAMLALSAHSYLMETSEEEEVAES